MCCTSFFKFMNGKKTWLKPIDPYYTIEIDFTEDIEVIREKIRELKRMEEERINPDEGVDPSEEADPTTIE